MDVVVCLKRVPEVAEVDLQVDSTGKRIKTEGLPFVLNEWDSYALEEAVRIKERMGAKVTAVTVGAEEDDEILRRMNRGYGAETYREVVWTLYKRIPGIALGADVIVGFPGESDAQFERTRRVIEELPLSVLHVFPFSKRAGTKAAEMGELVDEKEVARALALFDPVWETLSPREQVRVIRLLVQRVDYDGEMGTVSVTFHPAGIKTLADELEPACAGHADRASYCSKVISIESESIFNVSRKKRHFLPLRA